MWADYRFPTVFLSIRIPLSINFHHIDYKFQLLLQWLPGLGAKRNLKTFFSLKICIFFLLFLMKSNFYNFTELATREWPDWSGKTGLLDNWTSRMFIDHFTGIIRVKVRLFLTITFFSKHFDWVATISYNFDSCKPAVFSRIHAR